SGSGQRGTARVHCQGRKAIAVRRQRAFSPTCALRGWTSRCRDSGFADLPIDRVDARSLYLRQDFVLPWGRDRKFSELHNLARAELVNRDDFHRGHETTPRICFSSNSTWGPNVPSERQELSVFSPNRAPSLDWRDLRHHDANSRE